MKFAKSLFVVLGFALLSPAPFPHLTPFPNLIPAAHAQERTWITQFGTSESDYANALASDGVGGVIVSGQTQGNLGGSNAGGVDVFLARYDDSYCYADCDQSTGAGVLDLFDFLCWQNSFVNAEPYACDCDTSTGNGVCDVFDFLCFQSAFVGGCP